MATSILANFVVSLTDFKRDPMGAIREGQGETVVILNQKEPAFYAAPPARYQAVLDLIDDLRLAELIHARQGELTVAVDIDELIAQATDPNA